VPTSYKQRITDYLANHRNIPVIQKIVNLEQLTSTDINELERVLWKELGTKEDYEKYVAKGNRLYGGSVAAFIR
jgi:type I restriction enzyme R subunit